MHIEQILLTAMGFFIAVFVLVSVLAFVGRRARRGEVWAQDALASLGIGAAVAASIWAAVQAMKVLFKVLLPIAAGSLAAFAMWAYLNRIADIGDQRLRGWLFAGDWLQPIAAIVTGIWVASAVWSALRGR